MNGIQVNKQYLDDSVETKKYVKKPIPIRAVQVNTDFWVHALEGNHQGKSGDYLIEGIRGELYCCDKEIFEESYTISFEPFLPNNWNARNET